MSEYSLDEPGFAPPVPPVPLSSSESSVETPVDGRRKCRSTVAYLRRSGGTFSSTLNATAREVLLWAENHRVRLLPQFIMGSSNVTADALKSPQSVDRVGMDPSPGGSRSAGPQMASGDRSVCNLPDREASSVFLTGLRSAGSRNGCSSPSLGRSPSLCLSSDRHHKESSSQTEVLEELRVDSHRSVLASEGLVPGPSGTVVRRSHHTVRSKRSSKTAPLPPIPSKSAYASADCMATIKRFARQAESLDSLSSVEDCPHA